MTNSLVKYALGAVAVLFIGPLATVLLRACVSMDGSALVSPLLSASPVMSYAATIGIIALAAGIGCLTAPLVGYRWGLLSAGLVAVWPAARSGDIAAAFRVAGTTSPLLRLAIDGFVIVALGAGVAFAIQHLARDRQRWGATDRGGDARPVAAPVAAAIGTAVSIASCLLACFVIAQTGVKGQAIFAAACGSMLAGVLIRALAIPAPAFSVLLGAALVALAGPIVVSFGATSGLERAVNATGGPAMLRVLGWDWLAGALIGLPIGLAWNTQHHEHEQPSQTAAARPA